MATDFRRFSRTLAATARKTDNHPKTMAAKIELRRRVLAAVGADSAAVLDCFAGQGAMWRAVWRHAGGGYVGIDQRWFPDQRLAYVADNKRVLRALDLGRFSIFDCDAYGSPWEQLWIISDRRQLQPGEQIGVLITEGSGLTLKLGGMPGALSRIAGLDGHAAGAFRNQKELLDRAINGLARRMRATVAKRWQASGKTGASVVYAGLLLRGA